MSRPRTWTESAAALSAAGVIDLSAGVADGPEWSTLPELLDDLPLWHAHATELRGDARGTASFLATWVAGAPAIAVALPYLQDRVAPRLADPRDLALRRVEGEVVGYRVSSQVEDRGAATDAAVAREVAALVDPLVDAVCAVLPMGHRVVWGSIADAVAGYAVYAARSMAGDALETWRRVNALLNALAEHAPLRRRPQLFPVVTGQGETHFTVRATCCLYYRFSRGQAAATEAYCSSCPLRDDASRAERLRAHVESLSAASR